MCICVEDFHKYGHTLLHTCSVTTHAMKSCSNDRGSNFHLVACRSVSVTKLGVACMLNYIASYYYYRFGTTAVQKRIQLISMDGMTKEMWDINV